MKKKKAWGDKVKSEIEWCERGNDRKKERHSERLSDVEKGIWQEKELGRDR